MRGINCPIMSAIKLNYTNLGFEPLVKIFELADLLGVTPKVAAEIYLKLREEEKQHRRSA